MQMKSVIYTLKDLVKKGNLKKIIKRIFNCIKFINYKVLFTKKIDKLIKHINKKADKIILFPYVVDWNIPLFQRPQHIARCLAQQGYTYIFFTGGTYDKISSYEKKEENLYVVNKIYMKDFLKKINVSNKFVQLYSTDMNTTNKDIDYMANLKYKIFYEYIDEISPALYGSNIPLTAIEKHNRITKDMNISVICTARKLYYEIYNIRGENKLSLITNGVDVRHFRSTTDIGKKLVKSNKKIIGYFGAIASWFDFELIQKLAKERPDYEIILIGSVYGKGIDIKFVKQLENVLFLGAIDYNILPQYAKEFDVSIIPFKINDITNSTSPIKLFEYMALGKPIVTTAMPECRMYKSVMVAETHEDFINRIDEALKIKDDIDYIKTLKREADENTWFKKAQDIIELISY